MTAGPPDDTAANDGQEKAPLIVDMDHTILRTDTLVEGIVAGVFQKPFAMMIRLATAVLSRPRFKSWVFKNVDVDYEAIPTNEKLIDYLRSQRKRGRPIHLVSAADQGVVDRIAAHFGIFDSALGSSNGVNLKGRRKLGAIRQRFGDSFVYVGDSRPDMKVWSGSTGGIYAGTNASIRRRLTKRGDWLEADFSQRAGGMHAWLKALRLHQWTKNLLIFAPLILSHHYTDLTATLETLLAFLVVGITASGTYLINDMSDLGADRRHRTKRNRPLASGAMPLWAGLILAPILIAGGLAAAYFLAPLFAVALAGYLVLTLSYSLKFKITPLLDVFILAALYTLRLVMGTIVAGADYSLWLLTFSMFFFFSLSLAKRHVELIAPDVRPGVAIRGRGYYPEDAPLTRSLGIASATASILILVLYLVDEAYGVAVYKAPVFLAGIPVIIAIWTARIWLLAHRGQLDDDPVSFATRDRVSFILGFVLVVLMAAALFVDGLRF